MQIEQAVAHVQVSLEIVLDRELPDLTADTRLVEDLALDSFGFVELLGCLEDTLGIAADPDDLQPDVFETVGTLAGYVARAGDPLAATGS